MVMKKPNKIGKAEKNFPVALAPDTERRPLSTPTSTTETKSKKEKKLHAVALRKDLIPLIALIKEKMIANMEKSNNTTMIVNLRTVDVMETCLYAMAEKLGIQVQRSGAAA